MTALRPAISSAPSDDAPPDHDTFARIPTAFVCDGCGYRSPAAAPAPMRCPAAVPGDGIDHVLGRLLDTGRLSFPSGDEPEPFVRYRSLFHGAHVASALGWPDEAWTGLVGRLDAAVARVDGHGFGATPLVEALDLARRLGMTGAVLVKDETGNVAGSHKARHLMGTALELEIGEALERADPVRGASVRPARLAIASCGNAALAAAVVARAWERELHVYVPSEADPAILARLRALGAVVTIAPRVPGEPGDPTYRMLRAAVDDGAVPFTCQGPDNGLALQGGQTLGYELVSGLAATDRSLDRLVVQVGGGALASSCIRALADAHALGALDRLPRIHAVQGEGVRPLLRAYDLVADRLAHRLGVEPPPTDVATPAGDRSPAARAARAEALREAVVSPEGRDELARIAHHRSSFMWPWAPIPRSVATGILDDETYDWYAVVRAMLVTGGYPVAASENSLRTAARTARAATGIDVDATGSAGLAGLAVLRRARLVGPAETVAVLFTGIRRTPSRGPSRPTQPAHGARP